MILAIVFYDKQTTHWSPCLAMKTGLNGQLTAPWHSTPFINTPAINYQWINSMSKKFIIRTLSGVTQNSIFFHHYKLVHFYESKRQ